MPLPAGSGAWPPADVKPYLDQAKAAAAWWSGDEQALANTADAAGTSGRRRFWQRRKKGDVTTATRHLHAGLASDVAAVSADLLFGDIPNLALGGDATASQARLEELIEAIGLWNRLLEGAEHAAAVGGCYLRPAWDTDVADHPLLQVVPQDRAVPDFRYGQLAAVTLWEDVLVEKSIVWRHLERHEPGRILHGLYSGTANDLGNPIPLDNHPTTEGLDPEVVLGGTLTGRLLPDYVPNTLPNRKLPRFPIGRPDVGGDNASSGMLDALDEAWTSWMRDLRLGQARIMVPEEYLTPAGARPGSGRTLDIDTEVFTPLNVPDNGDKAFEITPHQFELRVKDHSDTVMALTEAIVSTAGYSPQTFGLRIEGRAEAGTALRIREGKTSRTQGRKQRYWKPGVCRTAETLMLVDADQFGGPGPGPDGVPALTWGELEVDPAEKATWIQTLRTAQAISIDTAVRLAQPDLDDDAVAEETARIVAEQGIGVPDPLANLDQA